MNPIFQTLLVPASGSALVTTRAKVLTVKTCTLPLLASFDGQQGQTIAAGTVLDQGPEGWQSLAFINLNAADVTVTFWIGDEAVSYQPGDNSVSNAQTFAFGALGIPVNTAAGVAFTGSPACDALGYLQISNASTLLIPAVGTLGKALGHRRQSITFSVGAKLSDGVTASAPLNLLDEQGLVFMTIPVGVPVQFVTDAPFRISGAGGTCAVTIGQVFLVNN